MTAVATEPEFSAESYRRHANAIPSMDGQRATTLNIRFSGSGVLDHTSADDLALLEAMRLGREIRLIVTGAISGKRFELGTSGQELSYACTVKVASVEACEMA